MYQKFLFFIFPENYFYYAKRVNGMKTYLKLVSKWNLGIN